ncbi:hypothetical protein N9E48_02690 [Paracoccaceae bacterium]|nr:hypothetical protein [Paracoccaceae bacterium]
MDVVFPNRAQEHNPEGPNNWQFAPERIAMLTGAPLPECATETATRQAFRFVRNIHDAEGSKERSVPILYDRLSRWIVSNESAEIVRMLNRSAGPLGIQYSNKMRHNLYPADNNLREDINALNKLIYIAINNGAYKAGFSSDKAIYETAYRKYFDALAKLESLLTDGLLF